MGRRDAASPPAVDEDDTMQESRAVDEFQALVNSALPALVRAAAASENGKLYRSVMARVERPLLRQALDLAGGNQLKAARLLGINRNTLRKRLRLLGLLAAPAPNGVVAE
jgi:two-component system nitrogen regulation response regulator GlnG